MIPRTRSAANRRARFLACLMLSASFALAGHPANASGADSPRVKTSGQLLVYVGTYTRGTKSKGIYVYRLDLASGVLTPVGTAAGAENPSFLAIRPDGRFLYSVSETGKFQGQPSGAVAAFAIDARTGQLRLLNQQPSAGSGPCHLVVDRWGKNVLVANYGSGSVGVLPIQQDGRLAPPSSAIQHQGSSAHPQRQRGPHAHSVNLDPANRFAFVADLGLDKVLIYRFDADRGSLTPHEPPSISLKPGAGPRHLAFHPNGRFAYVINEIDSTLTAMQYRADAGQLAALQTLSTLPEPVEGNTTADVHVHPSGRFLYGSNRGHESIAIFAIDGESGQLTAMGHASTRGRTPRNFALDPTGQYLLAENQASNTIVVFRIDPQTGKLSPTGQVVEVPAPVCIQMMPVPRP